MFLNSFLLPAVAHVPLTIFSPPTPILEVLPGLEHILHLCHLWFCPLFLWEYQYHLFKMVKCEPQQLRDSW